MIQSNLLLEDEKATYNLIIENGADPDLVDVLLVRLNEAREEAERLRTALENVHTPRGSGVRLVQIAGSSDRIIGLANTGRAYTLLARGWTPLPEITDATA